MENLKTIEINILQAVQELLVFYQKYEDNAKDNKYLEVKENFIQPMNQRVALLIEFFGEIDTLVQQLEQMGAIKGSELGGY